jgi:23S rRNA (cytosine1962-C5)-methyltransferase
MSIPTLSLAPREDLRIRAGHPWIYDNEIARTEGNPAPGDVVRVHDARSRLLGYGFFNPSSKIRIRLFSRHSEKADRAFFEESFRNALSWRTRFFDPSRQSLRLVFGEADSVPGLIVDLFAGSCEAGQGRWLSCQFLSLGVEMRKAEIIEALESVFHPDGIVERSDAPVRRFEGLSPVNGVLRGTVPERMIMEENGARFAVDIAGGQKTGWFLDQRANRAATARHASGRNVLDAFCNQGGFGILCAKSGATGVTALDSSALALDAVRENAALNGVSDRITCIEANAFDQLRGFERDHARFDLVILDPPAFAKSRSTVEAAHRGYKEINVRAMRLLPKEGLLVTCSCSHWFDGPRFDAMLAEAAFDCGRRFRIVEERSQDLDHPVISGYGESRYLKCRILEMA